MKVDLSCPIELWAYALPTEEKAACSFTFFNLGERPISSIQITVTCYGTGDEVLSRRVERPMALEAEGRAPFTVELSAEGIAVESLDLTIDKAWFADGDEWRRAQEARFLDYEPNELPENRKLEQLRYIAGSDAVGFPSQQKGVWVCVCGRVNAAEETVCRRCQREKQVVFELYSEEAVQQAIDLRESALEDKARQAREEASRQEFIRQEKARRKKRGRRTRTAVICVTLVLVAVSYLFVVLGIPELRYQTALSDFEGGNIAQARVAFSELLDYRDSTERVKACDLRIAKDHIESGVGTRIDTALTMLADLTDLPETAGLINEGRYRNAKIAMDNAAYEDAAAQFEALGDYRDAADLALGCHYKIATGLFTAGSYTEAKALFESLGEYSDAPSMAKECVYRPAQTLQAEGKYDEAIEQYTLIIGYRDADEFRQQCIYQSGLKAQLSGDFELATERFMLLGDYADSSDQVKRSIYLAADQARNAEKYDSAAKLYASIPGYEDADTQAKECVYLPAKLLMGEGKYAEAAKKLAQIPDYLDANELFAQCVYKQGETAAASGDLTAAIDYFGQIEAYGDAAAQKQKAQYKQAEQLETQGEIEAAIDAFEAMGDYSDAAKRASQARYNLAQQAFDEGLYSLASERFALLGDYADAGTRVKECAYELALLTLSGGDAQAAYIALTAIEGYPKAATKAQEVIYGIAQTKYEAGDLTGAAEAFAQAGKYQDAQTKVKAITYEQAVALMESAQYEEAGEMFNTLGNFEDSRAKRNECYDLWLKETAENARTLYKQGDYQKAVDTLTGLTLDSLPSTYADLKDIYLDSNLRLARALINEDRSLEAYGYLMAASGYKNADELLDKNIYRILGSWQTADGISYVFYLNGTCVIAGETRVFNMRDPYGIQTGADVTSLKRTLSYVSGGGDTLTIRDDATGKNMRLTRVGPPQISPATPSAETPVVGEEEIDPDEEMEP